MHPRFEGYRKSKLGDTIAALAREPERITEYRLLSRMEMPAVIALSWDVKPLLEKLSEAERREAKQFCGAIVGDVMREHGYAISNPRGSAQAGGVFRLGAVWAPVNDDDVRTLKIASDVMADFKGTLKSLAR